MADEALDFIEALLYNVGSLDEHLRSDCQQLWTRGPVDGPDAASLNVAFRSLRARVPEERRRDFDEAVSALVSKVRSCRPTYS